MQVRAVAAHRARGATQVSLLGQWVAEARSKLADGSIDIVEYHSSNRCRDPARLAQADIVVTNYETVAADVRQAQKVRCPQRCHGGLRSGSRHCCLLRRPQRGRCGLHHSPCGSAQGLAECRLCYCNMPVGPARIHMKRQVSGM